MKRVTGIGGIFFKSSDPKQIYVWYQKHLGIDPLPDVSAAMFLWRDAQDPEKRGSTVWSAFPRDTKYFGEGAQTFMVNYRVENLDALLEELETEGVQIDPKRTTTTTENSLGLLIRTVIGSNCGNHQSTISGRNN
jgi:hypothetical protein